MQCVGLDTGWWALSPIFGISHLRFKERGFAG